MNITNNSIFQSDYEYMENRGSVGTYARPNQQVIKTIIPVRFQGEVEALCDYAGVEKLTRGMTIKMSLQEILTIIPKNRRRIESYKPLINFLSEEMGVALELTSKKTKNHERS